ncbi:MAG: NAD(P)/FAD-dependent oxidoreductase [Gammaproteobacteria bacterium]
MTAQSAPLQGLVEHHKIIIIGSGFSGLGMAIKLKESGESNFIVLEKEQGVGGTWRVNHYPGCACDVPSHLYSFSFEPNPQWSRMFAPQQEIKAYLERCAQKYDVLPHVRLGVEVSTLRWDEARQLWQIQCADGRAFTASIVVSGMGGLAIPAYPNVKGLENFQGRMFHSQQWDHDYDLRGKRVAVIGTGASAIQFVPHVQKQAARLDLYQRTAPWIMSKPDRAMTWLEKNLFQRFPASQRALRDGIYWALESRVLAFVINPRIMAIAKRQALQHIRKQISNPELRKKVTPDYTIGCKRILMSDEYYPALDSANVDVITDGIREVRANSIVDVNGVEREVDAIIFGTGFKAADPVPPGVVFGRNGKDLGDIWQQGPEAYKGTTVAGFPNLFFLMGPNTGLGHNSMVYMIESQIAYVLDALKTMTKKRLLSVEVRQRNQDIYNADIQGRMTGTVWSSGGCQSWYIHPVSGKNVTLWPGFTWQFRQQTRRFDVRAYRLNTTTTETMNEVSA